MISEMISDISGMIKLTMLLSVIQIDQHQVTLDSDTTHDQWNPQIYDIIKGGV